MRRLLRTPLLPSILIAIACRSDNAPARASSERLNPAHDHPPGALSHDAPPIPEHVDGLFVTSVYSGTDPIIEPIAVFQDSSLVDPADLLRQDSGGTITYPYARAAAFRRALYDWARPVHLIHGGIDEGELRIVTVDTSAGCAGPPLDATVRAQPETALLPNTLAMSVDRLAQARYRVTALTPEEKTEAGELARQTLRDNLSGSLASRLLFDTGFIVRDSNTAPAMAVAFSADSSVDADTKRVESVFLIADSLEGSYHVSIFWHNAGQQADVIFRRPTDALDLDRDGSPELIVRTDYYEATDYSIYRRRANKWSLWYTGGGHGC